MSKCSGADNREVIKISNRLEEVYWADREFDIVDKLELILLKAWSQLYLKDELCIDTLAYIEKNYNLLELNEYDEVLKIKILYYLNHNYNSDYSVIASLVQNILDEKTREHYKGIYKSYTDMEEAKKILENVLQKEKRELKRADIKLYLAKVLAKLGKIKEAVKYTEEATVFLNKYMTPIQEKIVLEIKQDIGEENYEKIVKEITIERVDDSFLLDSSSLPKKIISRDGKKMLLVEQGFSIYGEDNFDIPTIEELLNNPEDILSNKKELQSIRYLPSFYIDETPVTVKEYKAYCREANIDFHNEDALNENKPIRNLTIEEMQKYASFYGKTLPLPEEWEKACRGEENFNYPWGNEWDETVPIKINEDDFTKLKELFVSHKSFEDYFEWFNSEDKQDYEDLGVLNKIKFKDNVNVNKFYFFKLLFHSLSLNTLEKFRVIDAIPTLSQFQVDELIKVFEEEANKFFELNKKHPEDIIKLFGIVREGAIDIIKEITLEGSQYVERQSPYGVKNMVGNDYEVTMKENKIVFKGNIVTHDYKEKFKGKTSWIRDIGEDESKEQYIKEYRSSRTTFRCVKPIFSIEDLEEVWRLPQILCKREITTC